MTARTQQARRVSSLIHERKVSGIVVAVVLSFALLTGIIGFAVHAVWVVSVITMALGLGYILADSRRDRREVHESKTNDTATPA